jgi:hypothetical protein
MTSTNLPELPTDKNLFWRVAELPRYGYIFFGPTPASAVAVQIVEKYEELESKLKKNGKPRNRPLKTVVKERVLHHTTITREEEHYEDVYDDDGKKIGVKTSTKRVELGKGDLNPEIILATAEKTLTRYLEIVESEKLLGDYPPKTLPVKEPKTKKSR